jgi:hypothetical protein
MMPHPKSYETTPAIYRRIKLTRDESNTGYGARSGTRVHQIVAKAGYFREAKRKRG